MVSSFRKINYFHFLDLTCTKYKTGINCPVCCSSSKTLQRFNTHSTGSFLWSYFVKKCSEANAQNCVAKTCPVDILVRRTLRLHQYFGLLPMMPPHQQGITLYGPYLLVRQYDQVQPFPQVDL
jgi:hypothetical protein